MSPSAFIDNTSIHHLYKAMELRRRGRPLSAADAVVFFQFAEHIMLCDQLFYSGFEPSPTVELTQLAIEKMQAEGYAIAEGDERFVQGIPFTTEQYAAACRAAAPSIFQDLTTLGDRLKGLGRFANESTRPTPTKDPPMVKWLTHAHNESERERIGESALAERSSIGAYDYVVTGSTELYELLQRIGGTIHRDDLRGVAAAVGVFFRSAINQELAAEAKTYYTPAPQRARIVHEADRSFLHALEKTITETASNSKLGLETDFLGRAWIDDHLPLPLFALHFLREGANEGSTDILALAQDLRSAPEVKAVRKWLADWEARFASRNIGERKAARAELALIARELGLKLGKAGDYTSLLSVTASMDLFEGTVSIDPDLPGKFKLIAQRMRLRNRRRRLFIAAIATDIAAGDLGRDVMRMLGPPS